MTALIARQLQFIFLAWISLVLSCCGGVIIGNPGGGPTTPKPPNSGIVKITFGDPTGEAFEKVYFNVIGITFSGRESSQTVKYDQAKKIDAVRKGKSETFEVAFEEKVNSGVYDEVTIQLDPKEPIAVLLKNSKDFIIVGKNKPTITIPQKLEVLPDKEQNFYIKIDLEKAIKIPENAGSGAPVGVDFDPSGSIATSETLRKISGTINGPSVNLCLYRMVESSMIATNSDSKTSTGTASESRALPVIGEINKTDLNIIRRDYTCTNSWFKKMTATGPFEFSGLFPGLYISLAFMDKLLVQEDFLDVRQTDKSDVVIEYRQPISDK